MFSSSNPPFAHHFPLASLTPLGRPRPILADWSRSESIRGQRDPWYHLSRPSTWPERGTTARTDLLWGWWHDHYNKLLEMGSWTVFSVLCFVLLSFCVLCFVFCLCCCLFALSLCSHFFISLYKKRQRSDCKLIFVCDEFLIGFFRGGAENDPPCNFFCSHPPYLRDTHSI